jgi:hypothetical protein
MDDLTSTYVLTVLESTFDEVDAALVRDVTAFVTKQTRALPPHLRLVALAVSPYLLLTARRRTGQWLWLQDRAGRQLTVESWRNSPLSPVRQYLRLLRSLALFSAYERQYGEAV